MDSGEVQAKITQMREGAAVIRNSAHRIHEAVESAEVEVRSLGLDRFTSGAAEAFRAHFNSLTPRLRESSQSLLLFQEKLATADDDIDAAARALE